MHHRQVTMDVQICAKLDTNGKIISVQSVCSSTDDGPMSPTVLDRDSIDGPEKFVPYMEKKKLVYKLDAKVDEMSIMIQQFAELTEKHKLQTKLLREYECKIAAQQKKIRKLEAENFLLKSHVIAPGGKYPHALSLDRSITMPKHVCPELLRGEGFGLSTRSLSWPDGINNKFSSSVKSLNNRLSEQIDKRKVDMMSALNKTHADDDEAIHDMVSGCKPIPLPKCDAVKIQNVNTQNGSPLCFQCDKYGYLDMTRGPALPVDKILNNSSVPETRIWGDSVDGVGAHTDDIHATHQDVQKKKNSAPDRPRPKVCDSQPRYEKIHFVDDVLPGPAEGPPLPPRGVSRSDSKSSITSLTGESDKRRQSDGHISCKNKHSGDYVEPIHGRTSIPYESRTRMNEITPTSLPIRKRTFSSSSTLSTESGSPLTPKEFGSSLERNSSNIGGARKDDTCALNILFKDMRTTSEWNKTKKRLMHQSHMHTVDYIEKQLRTVVEDVFKTYGTLKTGHRSRQHTKDKVLEKMKEKMEKQRSLTIVSEDFLLKCIDMVIITTPT